MTQQKADRSPVLSVAQTAEMLGVSLSTAYTLARRADFPSFHVSANRIVISRAGLEKWIAEQLNSKGGKFYG